MPQRDDETPSDDQRAPDKDRRTRPDTKENQIDGLGDEKEQRHIDPKQSAKIPGWRIDRQAIGKQYRRRGNEQPDAPDTGV